MRLHSTMRCLALAALACLVCSVPTAAAATTSATLEQDVVRLVNVARAERGLGPLEMRSALTRAARAHSRDMVTRGFFAHDAPGGPDFGSRILGYYTPRRAVGETIAWGSGSLGSPEAIVAGWMRSRPHRATLLDRRYTQIGIGIAGGTFAGTPGARVYTADFGG
jgi:uncharacterized protein YkwD